MKAEMKSRFFFGLLFFSLVFFGVDNFLSGYANVSRSPKFRSFGPRIAVDSLGNVHVVWADYYTPYEGKLVDPGNGDAFYAKYDVVTKQWSDPLNISNSSLVFSLECRNVGIAIGPGDNIYVVYVERNRIILRIFSEEVWGDPVQVADSGELIDMPRIAIDSAGNIFTSWWAMGAGVVYSRAMVNGTWENVRTLSPVGLRSKFPNIAVGHNLVFCTWQQGGGEFGYMANYVRRSTSFNASWSESTTASPIGGVICPNIKVDGNDVAHLVFTNIFRPSFNTQINYARWTGNGFGRTQAISGKVLQLYASIYLRGGNVYVCWPVGSWGYGKALHYNNLINGGWSGENSLPSSAGCTYVDVATSPSQDKIYYVWDDIGKNPLGSWEIWCNLGDTGEEPPPGDEPPIPKFTFSPKSGLAPIEVTFDGSASSDPDGSIVRYSWDFGDGSSALGQVVKHIYTRPASFRFTLTVTDNLGARASKSAIIKVRSLFSPLNVSWSTQVDESLFKTSTVTEIRWEKNPANDAAGYQIALYRIYRKLSSESDQAYMAVGEVSGNVYRFFDRMAAADVSYIYTVTALDSQGHESPVIGQPASSGKLLLRRDALNPKRMGRSIK